MKADKIFAVALIAAKPGATINAKPRVECEPWAVASNSLEAAEALGLKEAQKKWPELEGWSFHAAHAIQIVIHPVVDDAEPIIELIM